MAETLEGLVRLIQSISDLPQAIIYVIVTLVILVILLLMVVMITKVIWKKKETNIKVTNPPIIEKSETIMTNSAPQVEKTKTKEIHEFNSEL